MKDSFQCSQSHRAWAAAVVVMILLWGAALPTAAKDEDDIDKVVGKLINAFRTGNYEPVVPHFSEDITVVASGYASPLVGLGNVLRAYQGQHQRLTGSEMFREGTKIERKGKVAWVTYRWRYAANIDGEIFGFEGHTTLVLRKQGKRWVIVHNHTSALVPPQPTPPAS